MRIAIIVAALAFASAGSAAAQVPTRDAHVQRVAAWANANIKPWLGAPEIVDAVRAQNARHAGLDYPAVLQLDADWRAGKADLKAATLNNPLSAFLKRKREELGGVVIDMLVMDNRGLNVGQTDATSDYFQADEPKWQKSFGAGPQTVFVDAVEADGGSRLTQASLPIMDGDKPIGAITVGIDVDRVK